MMKTLLAAATLAVFSAPALAQTPTAPPAAEKSMAEQAFAKHDANKDGALSLTEVQTIDTKITRLISTRMMGTRTRR